MKFSPRLQFYFDKKLREVKAASLFEKVLGIKPNKHPDRFIYIGAWQPQQNFPYIEGNKIKRKSYKIEVLYEIGGNK